MVLELVSFGNYRVKSAAGLLPHLAGVVVVDGRTVVLVFEHKVTPIGVVAAGEPVSHPGQVMTDPCAARSAALESSPEYARNTRPLAARMAAPVTRQLLHQQQCEGGALDLLTLGVLQDLCGRPAAVTVSRVGNGRGELSPL